MHMMTYDQAGKHSTMELAQKSAEQAVRHLLPVEKLTLGLPFYGRNLRTGDWKSYEDLLKSAAVQAQLDNDEVDGWYFNSVSLIGRKTTLAVDLGLRGVMIWEVGQDCRANAVVRGQTTHVATCGPAGKASSLLQAIASSMPAGEDGGEKHYPVHEEL
mmetsp:Transcript_30981/g.71965  ORF Transcript_30981/g.71965 Transcript_30981/m.71965 type:complete len:158 (-) Transcript_30981:177-650(-)